VTCGQWSLCDLTWVTGLVKWCKTMTMVKTISSDERDNGDVKRVKTGHASQERTDAPAVWDRGFPAVWDRGFPAVWDRGFPAVWDRGFPAMWDRGFPALVRTSRLVCAIG